MEINIEIFLLALKANAFTRSLPCIHQRRQKHYKWCLRFHWTANLPTDYLQSYKTYLEHTGKVNDIVSVLIVLTQSMVCNLATTPSLGTLLFFLQGTTPIFLFHNIFFMSSFSDKTLDAGIPPF